MVRRSMAIVLGIVCILLIAGLGGAMVYYVSTHHHTDSDYDSLNSQNTNLNNIVNLNSSTVLVNNQTITQAAGNYTSWKFPAVNAGFILVDIENPTTNNIYIRVINDAALLEWFGSHLGPSHTYQYDNQVNGYPFLFNNIFPVLPTYEYYFVNPQAIPNLEIRIGNTNTVDNATLTVTITYHY